MNNVGGRYWIESLLTGPLLPWWYGERWTVLSTNAGPPLIFFFLLHVTITLTIGSVGLLVCHYAVLKAFLPPLHFRQQFGLLPHTFARRARSPTMPFHALLPACLPGWWSQWEGGRGGDGGSDEGRTTL